MNFDPLEYPYQSRRTAVFAKNGMVATSQPLAAQAGLEILKKGGNAVDAAIATAACLTVVEPTSNGIGGDAFALIWANGKLHGLNSSGPAPQGISIEIIKSLGYKEMPHRGWIPVTVPGIPAAWAALWERFGRLPFPELFAPAIKYAQEGYPLSPILAKYWKKAVQNLKDVFRGEEFAPWWETFTVNGKAPEAGEIWRSPQHGRTLQLIGESKAEAFYRGELAEKIHAFSVKHGGFLRKEDLASFHPQWVTPININYRGYDVWEIPPNGQGLNTLMALNILRGLDFPGKNWVDTYHKQIEAMKLAFTDGKHYITDPKFMKVTVKELLSENFAAARRKLIGDTALTPLPGTLPKGGTVYLACADKEGNMVSYIQSNYSDFGSGIVIPDTGIALQNRGREFSLNPEDINALMPGKKTYHTIIPGFLTKDGEPVVPFGVMGAYMQPQGHLQVIINTIDFHLNPQAALDASRWMWHSAKTVFVEPHFPDHLAQALERKGHNIIKTIDENGFGRGQIIWRNPQTGVLIGGTDPRTDSQIACW
ncbi:MAG: gamma-glutamyltransferase family protein [Clostridia bacterium]|nr:gamma-glutamyltransferase family protein [Clostridia bacterium]